jgi:nucleoside-diphosphate-sugar epimerase
MRIAIIGANGQVGSEVCLLLHRKRDVDLIPICRNRLGSSFLRYQGVPCLHAQITDRDQALFALKDCAVVANLALATGSPREIFETNNRLIRNCIECSAPGATIVFFSTASVYGVPTPSGRLRKNAYAREKLRNEESIRKLGRKYDRRVVVLRPGHICGELQTVTHQIRQDILAGPVHMPDPDRASNTVYTVTVADAILGAADGRLTGSGTFDLMNVPQWTWREIYEYEARKIGSELTIVAGPHSTNGSRWQRAAEIIAARIRQRMSAWEVRDLARTILSRLPHAQNLKLQAMYLTQRARQEISGLHRESVAREMTLWPELRGPTLRWLLPTRELLSQTDRLIEGVSPTQRWPVDLNLGQGISAGI